MGSTFIDRPGAFSGVKIGVNRTGGRDDLGEPTGWCLVGVTSWTPDPGGFLGAGAWVDLVGGRNDPRVSASS